MILKLKEFKDSCKQILSAVDATNNTFAVGELLELEAKENKLYLNVTNKEYYVSIVTDLTTPETFKAVLDAKLFLNLISKSTTDIVELTIEDTYLVVKANGTYKLPLIYDGDNLLNLPRIDIENQTSSFSLNCNILHSILNYNSKEITKATNLSKPVQRLYYVDELGCITFTTGACVNSFNLDTQVKLLLNDKLVKLFKLFKNEEVNVTLGFNAISENTIQQKIRLEAPNVTITSILVSDNSLISKVPVEAIRRRANNSYLYSINFDKNSLIQSIDRLLLFNNSKNYGHFEFTKNEVVVYESSRNNFEKVPYFNSTLGDDTKYCASIDLLDLKLVLDSCVEQDINICFGDSQAFVISRGSIKNIIPEVREV